MDPEIGPKLAQKLNQIHVNIFIGDFDFYQTKTQKQYSYIRKTPRGKSVTPILELILDPKMGPKNAKNGVKQWTHFRIFLFRFLGQFWVHFGGHFGFKMAQEAPTWAQESPQELQSTEKQHLHKMLFYKGKTILFESWGLPRRA